MNHIDFYIERKKLSVLFLGRIRLMPFLKGRIRIRFFFSKVKSGFGFFSKFGVKTLCGAFFCCKISFYGQTLLKISGPNSHYVNPDRFALLHVNTDLHLQAL